MRVSLDDGATWQEVDGVRVTYEDKLVPGEDESGVLCFNFTYEGLITDVWVTRGDAEHNIATSSETVEEMIDRMVENDR